MTSILAPRRATGIGRLQASRSKQERVGGGVGNFKGADKCTQAHKEGEEMGQAMSNPCCGRERLDKDAPCMPLRRITALQDARVHFINDSPMMCILRDGLSVRAGRCLLITVPV